MDVLSGSCGEGELPTAYSEHKHFPLRNYPERRAYHNYQIRAAAKRYAQSGEDERHHNNNILPGLDQVPKDQLRPKVEGFLDEQSRDSLLWKRLRSPYYRDATAKSVRISRGSDEEEGRRLAKSNIPLPVDRFRRRPSLEREDAFRDETTAKRNVQLRRRAATGDDAQIAELYQMGLLYDTEADHKPNHHQEDFTLNSIRHEQPIFPIRVSKRAHRSAAGDKPRSALRPLHLDLSFSDIGNDDIVARLMSAASQASSAASPSAGGSQDSQQSSPRSFAPLRVVYELSSSGHSEASIDADTSQPPDLILDDYDCFDDSDMEGDVPTQREVGGMGDGSDGEGTWVVLGDCGS